MLDEHNGVMVLHLAGDRNTLVYRKPDFTPATYTILNFAVDDLGFPAGASFRLSLAAASRAAPGA